MIVKMVRALRKARDIFLSPTQFYKRVKAEKSLVPVIIDFTILAIIPFALLMLFEFAAVIEDPQVALSAVILPLVALIVFPIMIGMYLVQFALDAAFLWLGLRTLGADKGFENSFRVTAYNYFIFVIYILLGVLAALFLIISEYGYDLLAIISAITLIAVFLGSLFHYLVAKVIGIAIIHEISAARAFWALVLGTLYKIGAIITIVGVFVLFGFMLGELLL